MCGRTHTLLLLLLPLVPACAVPHAPPANGISGLERVWIEALGVDEWPAARAVERSLRRLPEVAEVTVELSTNLVTIVPRSDTEFGFAAAADAVRAAGYRPGRMWLRARGDVVAADGLLRFHIAGWKEPLRLGARPEPGLILFDAAVRFSSDGVSLWPQHAPAL
ncbi:MAG TPA: hypothetical protein VK348_01655 [Planctomycetota bacterium]|nr:hypothetical protein [Planctomycetota bacterium]